MIRYALLVLVLALVGSVNTVSAATDANRINVAREPASSPGQLALIPPQDSAGQETKRFLRQETKTTAEEVVNNDSTEERGFIGTPLKNALYKILAAFGVRPQTVSVQLGVRTGRANALYNRFYHSYNRWYATHGPRPYMY
ncbi:hypothetical protein L915_20468 [Phytophthora nicotianae]|uniref:RxLR effector protein n=1 Tax=Phytophthora nicotianae TaxID=4792 RepID=W2FNS2_PHYNI|nr:hypothetical protein L915_20468 [Phytophthora nicotianae]ETM32355.1 hypothetical protein L914_20218 [Phytophthora nicotianae]